MSQIVAFKLKPPPAPEHGPEVDRLDAFLAAQEKRRCAEYWNLAHWCTSSKGNRYIVMDGNRFITVFSRYSGAFSWSIAQDGWSPLWSREFFPSEAAARRDAWETLAELI
jgi:hypothetical protein